MGTIHEFKRKRNVKEDVVTLKEDNIIYVDCVLCSMVRSVEEWYNKHYQDDKWHTARKTHVFHLIRFYDKERFTNFKTLNSERDKFLEEVDLYVQIRRDD